MLREFAIVLTTFFEICFKGQNKNAMKKDSSRKYNFSGFQIKKIQYKNVVTQISDDKKVKDAKISPISKLDIISTSPEAYIHKIQLGRALSSQMSIGDKNIS